MRSPPPAPRRTRRVALRFKLALQNYAGCALEVTLQDGRSKRLHTGEALAEVVDTAHNGRNVGDGPLRLVVFYAGAAGHPLTVKEARAE